MFIFTSFGTQWTASVCPHKASSQRRPLLLVLKALDLSYPECFGADSHVSVKPHHMGVTDRRCMAVQLKQTISSGIRLKEFSLLTSCSIREETRLTRSEFSSDIDNMISDSLNGGNFCVQACHKLISILLIFQMKRYLFFFEREFLVFCCQSFNASILNQSNRWRLQAHRKSEH